jgi:hypothetical protein
VGFAAPLLFMDTLNGTGFMPTHWVDVTSQFDAKCTAIRCHASQDPERFVVGATRQAAYRAGECNGGPEARAEAFRFEPRFPFADIRALLPPAPPVTPVLERRTVWLKVRANCPRSSTCGCSSIRKVPSARSHERSCGRQ